jgi:transposase
VPVCPAVRVCACGRPGCRRPRRYPSDATDAEWALLAPLLPVPACQTTAGGRPERHCRRAVVDAIRYVIHNGCVWRALPADFPPWRTVYGIYQRWNATGATLALHDALRALARQAAGRAIEPTAAVIDSQSVRAAPTVPKASRGWDNAKKTSDAVKLSSCFGPRCWRGCGEGGVFVVVLAGGQAVVQAAEEAAEEVALGGGVPVSVGFAPVVVGAGAG